MRPCGLYPTGSSVHGILQGRILEWLPCPPPGDLPDTGIEPMYLSSSAFQADFLPTEPSGNPVKVKVAQSCPILCNSPGENTGVVAFPFSTGFSQPRDQTQVSYIAGRFFTRSVTREAQEYWNG